MRPSAGHPEPLTSGVDRCGRLPIRPAQQQAKIVSLFEAPAFWPHVAHVPDLALSSIASCNTLRLLDCHVAVRGRAGLIHPSGVAVNRFG